MENDKWEIISWENEIFQTPGIQNTSSSLGKKDSHFSPSLSPPFHLTLRGEEIAGASSGKHSLSSWSSSLWEWSHVLYCLPKRTWKLSDPWKSSEQLWTIFSWHLECLTTFLFKTETSSWHWKAVFPVKVEMIWEAISDNGKHEVIWWDVEDGIWRLC